MWDEGEVMWEKRKIIREEREVIWAEREVKQEKLTKEAREGSETATWSKPH
jgi:hypothetical protein